MATIRETVTRTIGSRYVGQAEPALRALEQREQQQVEAARREMAQRGVNQQEQDRILVTIGLLPEPAATTTASSSDGGDLATIRQTVERLAEFARRHGFRG